MDDDTLSREATQIEARRHVAVLFTDLSDSTHLSGAMEAETYAAMLDQVRQTFRTAVEARGGTVNQFQGDGLQALFGHPEPTEHDSRRAADAAVEVHERVRALRERFRGDGAAALSVHSGIHAGVALARPGNDVAGLIELFGPAPGIAKHLSDIADADEILASDETLGPAGHFFHLGEARRVTLKGRSEPLAVRRVLARNGHRTRFEAQSQRRLVPFAGRQEALARLDALLADALAKRTRFSIVAAPAGLGKTRLIEEFLPHAVRSGCTVLRGDCDSELSAEPWQPLLQMLRTRLRLLPDAPASAVTQAVETWLVSLGPALAVHRADLLQALSVAPDATDGMRRSADRTASALQAVITALARERPLVLFIDDWQWVDRATRQLVHALCNDGSLPLLLLAAGRSSTRSEFDPSSIEAIELAPFGEREALATVAELLPAADPFVADRIVRQAGGNPLFIEELCHFAGRTGATPALQPAQGGPAWLEALIASRIAHLPAEQRRIIDAAAVIGTLIPAWLFERLTGRGADHPDVKALAEQDLLFPATEAGLLRFKHGITRDVVYGAIGLEARRHTHRAAARLLSRPGSPDADMPACEALAYHWRGAGDPVQAAHYATMAGDKAMAASSIDRAKAQYRTALELMDRLPPTPERYEAWRSVVRRLGLASVFDPFRDDLALFDRAVALAREHGDAAGLAFASYWRAYVSYALGATRTALRHGALALEAAMALGDPRLILQVRALQAQALVAAGNSAVAEPLLDEALSLIRRAEVPGVRPTPGLAYTAACRASMLGDRGCFDAAHSGFADALAALPGPGHEVEGSVLCLRSNVYLWQGLWGEAAADASAAQRVAERVRSLYLLAMSRSLGAWSDWQRCRDPRALQTLADATSWLIAHDKSLFISLNHGRLAEALSADGHIVQARRHAAAALWRWRRGDPLGAAMALRAMARLAAGDLARAARRLAMADRVADARGSAHERAANRRCRVELALELAAPV